jgi:hypothetical protein
MNKLLSIGLVKLVFLYFPAAAVVFTTLYFCGVILIENGLRDFIFIQAVAALAILLLLSNFILGPTISDLKNLHSSHKDGDGP